MSVEFDLAFDLSQVQLERPAGLLQISPSHNRENICISARLASWKSARVTTGKIYVYHVRMDQWRHERAQDDREHYHLQPACLEKQSLNGPRQALARCNIVPCRYSSASAA